MGMVAEAIVFVKTAMEFDLTLTLPFLENDITVRL
jgi:hypothetical protein